MKRCTSTTDKVKQRKGKNRTHSSNDRQDVKVKVERRDNSRSDLKVKVKIESYSCGYHRK